ANYLPQVPEPLRDRMEIIRLAGYLDQEKYAIARQFLAPKQLRLNGLDPADVEWETDVIPSIAQSYTRVAGVRALERRIARVSRKLARRRAESTDPAAGAIDSPDAVRRSKAVIRSADLKELLGPAAYDPPALTFEHKIGVATGLAYTSVGGDVLEIEVSVVGGRGKLQLTGTLGTVMKESATAALSYARARAGMLGIDRDFYRNRDLHLHIPAGATPKDGPSAGIAIATAIVSALTGIPIRGDVAMTGEITLRGRVLPIGGLKEKAVAAHRHSIRHVLIPHQNFRELEELPDEVRTGLTFHAVKTMDDVLGLALAHTDFAAEVPAVAPH
ncbi:MAG: S16 family serine protease, partial [Deltaproteobacteria bacterium]